MHIYHRMSHNHHSHVHMYIYTIRYIQFLLHVAFGVSGICLGAFGARWQLGVVSCGICLSLVPAVAAVAGNGILLWDLWPGRAKIPLFPLELLVRDPLVGAYPAPLRTFKEINMHVLVVWLDIDNDVKIVNRCSGKRTHSCLADVLLSDASMRMFSQT